LSHELFSPREKSLPLPLPSTHTAWLRGATQNLRGGSATQRKPTYFRDHAAPCECLPLPHSPTLRLLIRRIARRPTPKLSSRFDLRAAIAVRALIARAVCFSTPLSGAVSRGRSPGNCFPQLFVIAGEAVNSRPHSFPILMGWCSVQITITRKCCRFRWSSPAPPAVYRAA
jgi:hypothetical protein